jgi:hypothetical protein
MATTSNTYTGNGSNKLFSITFPYLDTSDIDVYLNGTLQTIITQYTFANATTVEFVAAPANGAVILLDRSTDDTTLQAEFFPGSSIKASDLNDDFEQVLYIAQETANVATTATSTAASAASTANTALSQAAAAVSTANTASSNASAAVSTANTASTNASNAVTTANTASSNASTAVTTANAAVVTANTASSNASAAVSTANTASSNASAAVSTANTASSNASAAVSTANAANSTANTASTNASNAVTTANAATATANTANTNASAAVSTANAAAADATNAIAAVSAASLYVIVANVAAIPGSPTNNQGVQVSNTTGLESFTPLSGIPVGFVGSAALYTRIRYSTGSFSWVWVDYAANDPEGRYLAKTGGTMTGALTFAGAQPTATTSAPNIVQLTDSTSSTSITTAATPASVKVAKDAADAAQTTANNALPKAGGTMTGNITFAAGQPTATTASPNIVQLTDSTSSTSTTTAATPNSVKSAYDLANAAQSTANTAVTNAAAAQSTANTAVTNAATAQTTANAALPKAGGTMTGDITLNAQSDLRFADADSSNWVAFQAPSTVSANVTWTLPATDASVSGYALKSDGAGILSWGLAGGALGGGTDQVFYENDQTVTNNYTLGTNKNAVTAGPITINSGITVTVPSGASWVIV